MGHYDTNCTLSFVCTHDQEYSCIYVSTLVRMFCDVPLSPLLIVQLGSLTAKLPNGPQCELDSHAAMYVVGKTTALRIHDFGNPVSVHGYLPDVGSREMCSTVSVMVALK